MHHHFENEKESKMDPRRSIKKEAGVEQSRKLMVTEEGKIYSRF
jgi:hypothetical protein